LFYLQLHCVVQPDDHMKLITAFYPPHLTTKFISLRFNSLENVILRAYTSATTTSYV